VGANDVLLTEDLLRALRPVAAVERLVLRIVGHDPLVLGLVLGPGKLEG
jgi:hypothetical protein